MTIEMWTAVPGFEGFYEASDSRRVRSLDRTITDSRGQVRHLRGRLLQAQTVQGVRSVVMYRDNTRFTVALDVVCDMAFQAVAA